MDYLKVAVLSLVLMLMPISAYAHPGGTNKQGCHTNNDTGKYHCNHGGNSSSSGSSDDSGSVNVTGVIVMVSLAVIGFLLADIIDPGPSVEKAKADNLEANEASNFYVNYDSTEERGVVGLQFSF